MRSYLMIAAAFFCFFFGHHVNIAKSLNYELIPFDYFILALGFALASLVWPAILVYGLYYEVKNYLEDT